MINLGQSVFQDTLIPQGGLTENGIYGPNIWEIWHPTSPLFWRRSKLIRRLRTPISPTIKRKLFKFAESGVYKLI